MRCCFKCKKVKELKDFYKNRSKALGIESSCKECEHDRAVSRKSYLTTYRKTHKKIFREGWMKWLSKNKEQYNANRKIVDRIRYGSLQRGNCLMCGVGNAEAHHQDYSKPLEIIWLCKEHHGEVKRKDITFQMASI